MRKLDPGERPRRRTELIGWYGAALAAQERSGLSVTQYAQQIGVNPTTLYQWRKRLGPAGERAPAAATPATPQHLVEVVVGRERYTASAEGPCAVVRLRTGQAVEVPRGFDSDDMRRLVTLLESC